MKKLLLTIITIFAFSSVFIGYEVYSLLNHKDRIEQVDLRKVKCRLQEEDCFINLDDGRKINILIDNRPIKINEENKVTVRLNFEPDQNVEVDFFGVNYDMGYNRETLVKAKKQVFAGRFMLPTCVEKKMLWDFTLLIDDLGLRTQFEVIK